MLIAYTNIGRPQEISSSIAEKETLSLPDEPSLTLPEALTFAQEYIEKNKIDTSKHYLDNIRLVQNSPWMVNKHWIITWRLKIPSDGGEIFIIVGMDKKIKIIGGR